MAKKTTSPTPASAFDKDGMQIPESLQAHAEAIVAAKTPKVPNQAITEVVAVNPKRGKSAPRFELYRSCKTTHEYILAGGYSADLAWDVKRGFIKLVNLEA